MPSKEIHTEVEGQKLKLTNIDKVLYPSIGITKAQFIQYYIDIAPYILKYIAFRPLTLIRYPDGVNAKKFYSKSKPTWTPEWVKSFVIQHETKDIDYLYLHNKASLIWMANLASLEIHPTQFKVTESHKPDHFIFDLDPDEDMDFDEIKETAFDIKEFLSGYGYTSFVKTSGGKGLHLYVPIEARWPYEKVTAGVKEIAKLFIQSNIDKYTLQVSKGKRKGKILIDIYRNHLGNTCIAPYSTRGKVGAPLSLPLTWDNLEKIKSSQEFNIVNYKKHFDTNGDPWADWRDHAVMLHTERKSTPIDTSTKKDERIEAYINKRDFEKTSEPIDEKIILDRKDEFVVQMHDATNLHYDLRLEHEGTLWSWAIPKGLPTKTGVKRLAIRTEDHPVKYLDFEGVIPKGSYGGGTMWVMDKGKISWKSKKEGKSLKFTLVAKLISGEYKLYRLRDNQWLAELVTTLKSELKTYQPMLAESSKTIPSSKTHTYEVKWDGIRAIIILEDGKISVKSRSGRDITNRFPEFQKPDRFKVESGVFDAEIVVLDNEGKPKFHDVISRMHSKKTFVNSPAKPATCYLFDIVNVDGIDISNFPFIKRREILEACIKTGNSIRLSDLFDNGELLFDAIKNKEMEGIMAKRKDAKYFAGQRSKNWLKIKCRSDDRAYIIGYTQGKGDRSKVFGALHLAKKEKGGLRYMGKVGTGFDTKRLKEIFKVISNIDETKKLITESIEEPANTVWIEGRLQCEISYASMSSNNTYREPVFKRIIDEKAK